MTMNWDDTVSIRYSGYSINRCRGYGTWRLSCLSPVGWRPRFLKGFLWCWRGSEDGNLLENSSSHLSGPDSIDLEAFCIDRRIDVCPFSTLRSTSIQNDNVNLKNCYFKDLRRNQSKVFDVQATNGAWNILHIVRLFNKILTFIWNISSASLAFDSRLGKSTMSRGRIFTWQEPFASGTEMQFSRPSIRERNKFHELHNCETSWGKKKKRMYF